LLLVVFFESTVLPFPSLECWVSVVFTVPGGCEMSTGAVEVVEDVVSDDVVCARAGLVINSRAQALTAKYFFIEITPSYFF
jgi:hypothetical protein